MDIQIFNLSHNIRDTDLTKLFSVYGVVNSVEVIRNKLNGRSNGNALVNMPIETEARQAIESLNHMLIDGKKITVAEIHLRPKW